MTDAANEPIHIEPPFGRAIASGAAWLGLAQAVRLCLTFLATLVVARLLSPGDYGVVAMAAPIFAFIIVVQDLGLSAATINARTITDEQSNSLFWINLAASALAAMVLLTAAPLIGHFYHEYRAANAAAVSAIGLLVSGLSVQHNALLNRSLRFRALALIDIASLLSSYGLTIVLAVVLRSYWALVFGSLAGVIIQTALAWRSSHFRPSTPSLKGVGGFARFGGHVTGFSLVNYFVRNLDNILVGRVAGAQQLGLYDRSYRLMLMPLQNINAPVSRLVQPILARLRGEPERYRRSFILALRLVMLASAPPTAVAVALSNPLMTFLLGAKWGGAGPIFFWLGLTGLLQPVSNLSGLLFLTTDRSRDFFRWGLLSSLFVVAAFVVGVTYGAVGVAFAFFASQVLLTPLRMWWAATGTPVRQSDFYGAQFEPLIGAGAVAVAARSLAPLAPFWLVLGGGVLLAYPASLLTSSVTPGGRQATREMWSFGRRHLPARWGGTAA